MKFNCEKNTLQEAISIVQKSITGKSTLPVLQGIYINATEDKLTLIGSDIDLSIETKINAEIIEEGSIVVDSRLFGDIIKKLPNDKIEINTLDNNNLQIICQRSVFNLNHMNSDDFPNIPNINEDIVLNISQKLLKNMIRGTIFATAQDETRPILTGVLFEVANKKLNLIALDGFRLALKNENIDNEGSLSAVIPSKTLSEVSKILLDDEEDVNITFTSNHILFSFNDTKVISRLLEGEFIKYNSIIPEEYSLEITAKKNILLDSIERASLVAKEGNTNLVKLEIEEENLIITSNSQLGRVREELSIIVKGEPLQIAFNSKYLIDVLKIVEDEEIVMQFSSSVSPCVIKTKNDEGSTYLVLPVRLLGN